MFVDEAVVVIKAGDGGNGCASFRRLKYEPRGGPNGGNGGKGGDVVLSCDANIGDLRAYYFKPNWRAKNGEPGRGKEQHGHGGADLELKVPPGIQVISELTGNMVAELTKHGDRVVLLKGGSGGLGNLTFKSSVNQAPRKFTEGTLGEEGRFQFVLKTIADVGLVGFPNAGKSSLIDLVTEAHPKTAAYPFTTLHPVVGVIEYPDIYERLFMADIPGLVEGAHENKGLGHRFLRHIERCKMLLIVLDMAGVDGRHPWDDYENLLEELRLYKTDLAKKPFLVAANKMDEEEAAENLRRFRKKFSVPVLPISCLTEKGIEDLIKALLQKMSDEYTERSCPADTLTSGPSGS